MSIWPWLAGASDLNCVVSIVVYNILSLMVEYTSWTIITTAKTSRHNIKQQKTPNKNCNLFHNTVHEVLSPVPIAISPHYLTTKIIKPHKQTYYTQPSTQQQFSSSLSQAMLPDILQCTLARRSVEPHSFICTFRVHTIVICSPCIRADDCKADLRLWRRDYRGNNTHKHATIFYHAHFWSCKRELPCCKALCV